MLLPAWTGLLAGVARAAPAGDGAAAARLAETVDTAAVSDEGTDDDAAAAASPADWLVPDPPALAALDEAGGAFDEPSTPSDFAVALGDFFDEEGRLRGGGAVEVGLRALGLTRAVSAARYRRDPLARALARTYLSAATTARDDDVVAAAGLRAALWGGADPLLAGAWREAVDRARAACADLRADPEAWGTCLAEAYGQEAKAIPEPAWNAAGATLSLATRWAFPGGSLAAGGVDALIARASLALPAGSSGQLGLGGGWTERPAPGAADEAALTLAGRLGLSGTRLSAELGWRGSVVDGRWSHALPLTLGGQVRVDDGMWLESSAGLSFSPGDDLVRVISTATLRWGQATEPAFKPE